MKVLEINICHDQSTGGVMNGIADAVRHAGGVCLTASPPKAGYNEDFHYVIGNMFERRLNLIFGRLISNEFGLSHFSTKKLIARIEAEKPDIIHFHNLHAYYLDLPLLISYINKNKYKIVWTFHDCWPITGHCTHFQMVGCQKWISTCENCPQYKSYPGGLFDNAKRKFQNKKKLFSQLEDLHIITPSKWLADIVRQSYLGDKDIRVINNGIDLSIFRPRDSRFREQMVKGKKHMLLGVASQWEYRKGIDIFNRLSEELPDEYAIVLVGTDSELEKSLCNNIIPIRKTKNPIELAEIYSAADLFLNPTREDTFPTVNIESLACGTPVLTFETGGSPEIITQECGDSVPCDNYDLFKQKIITICEEKKYSEIDCIRRSQYYNKENKFFEYVELYNEILEGRLNE